MYYVLDFIFLKVLDKVDIGYRLQSQSVELSVFTFVRDGSYDDPRERSSSPPIVLYPCHICIRE